MKLPKHLKIPHIKTKSACDNDLKQISAMCLQGMLINPQYCNATDSDIASAAIGCAKELLRQLGEEK